MKILVCTRSGIGNAITALPLVNVLNQMGHEVSVNIAEERGSRTLFKHLPYIKAIYDQRESIPQHDLAMCTVVCNGYHNGTCKHGEKFRMIEPGRKDADYFSIHRYTKHEFEHNMDLARGLGYTGTLPTPELPRQKVKVTRDKGENIILGIGHLKGDGNSERKHWGNENWATLADILTDNGYHPIVLGGMDDAPNAEEIVKLAKCNLEVHTDLALQEAFYLFTECGRCITNETMLVPASYGIVRCLSLIFTEALNNPKKTYPYKQGVALHGSRKDITPEIVFENYTRMIEDGPWTKIQPIPDNAKSIHASATSRLHCIRQGFGAQRPKVSIVALLCDFDDEANRETNVEVLDRIRSTAPGDCEIIVVANDPSTLLQEAIATAEAEDERILSVRLSQNVGVVAKNLGYNLAQGEIILSVDGDVFVEDGWVEKAVAMLESDEDIGIIGPCGGRMREDMWTEINWGCGDVKKGPRSYFGYEDPEYFGNQTASGIDGTVLDVIPSMIWGVRREVFETVGYLDWRFGPFVGSDSDLCFRAKEAGWKIVLTRLPMRHAVGGASSHRHISGLKDVKRDHLKALYDRWFEKRGELCELYK